MKDQLALRKNGSAAVHWRSRRIVGGRAASTFDVSNKTKTRYLFLIVNVSKRTLEQTGVIASWKGDPPVCKRFTFLLVTTLTCLHSDRLRTYQASHMLT
jgi:hypothetical protein